MPPLLTGFIRLLTGILGFILFYVAAFTYESTDNRIQSSLQDLWLGLAYDSRTPANLAKRLLWMVLNLMDRAFERIFGRTIISFRSFSSSLCYGYAAIPLSVVAAHLFAMLAEVDLASDSTLKVLPRIGQPSVQIGLGLTVVAIGTLPALHASLRWLTSIITCGILAGFAVATWAIATQRPESMALYGSNAGNIIAAAWVLLAYGIGVVYVIRYAVRALVNRRLTRRHLVLIASLSALPIFSFCFFLSVALIVGHTKIQSIFIAHLFGWLGWSFLLFVLGGNSMWGLALAVAFAFSLLVLLHLAIWPVIRLLLMKVLYAAQRHELIRRKAKLASIGLSTIACAVAPGPIGALWQRIVTNVRHLFA